MDSNTNMVSKLKQISCNIYKISSIGSRRNLSTKISSIPENSLENEKKMIELEMQIIRNEGKISIPDEVPDKYWNELLNIRNKLDRIRFLINLKKIEMKDQRTETYLEDKCAPNHIEYGLGKNSLFIEIPNSVINRFYNYNILHSVTLGQKVVFDFGYVEEMDKKEIEICINQIPLLYDFNKISRDPFDLYFCNVTLNSEFEQRLHEMLPKENLVTVSEKNYLDFFPKDKLVYLTPDCDNELERFSYDDVYIIGGLVTRNRDAALSLAKSEKENLRKAKFPLEKYLHWGDRTMNLTIEESFKILLMLKNTKNWYKGFEQISKGKVRDFRQENVK